MKFNELSLLLIIPATPFSPVNFGAFPNAQKLELRIYKYALRGKQGSLVVPRSSSPSFHQKIHTADNVGFSDTPMFFSLPTLSSLFFSFSLSLSAPSNKTNQPK